MTHHLELDDEQAQTLADALESLLNDLEEELAHTGSHGYKDALHDRREILSTVLVALKQGRSR